MIGDNIGPFEGSNTKDDQQYKAEPSKDATNLFMSWLVRELDRCQFTWNCRSIHPRCECGSPTGGLSEYGFHRTWEEHTLLRELWPLAQIRGH